MDIIDLARDRLDNLLPPLAETRMLQMSRGVSRLRKYDSTLADANSCVEQAVYLICFLDDSTPAPLSNLQDWQWDLENNVITARRLASTFGGEKCIQTIVISLDELRVRSLNVARPDG